MKARILVVEDERAIQIALSGLLRREGYEVEVASNGEEALAKLGDTVFDLVLTDLALGRGPSGMEVLRRAKDLRPEILVVMITAHGSEKIAVEAMKAGAEDYVPKPFDNDEIRLVVQRCLDRTRLERENRMLIEQVQRQYGFENLIGSGPAMRHVFEMMQKVAETDLTVLVRGESGTGKELVAQALHNLSSRKKRPFVAVNCAAISKELVESELFGHEKGAFTGALDRKIGRFELAHEGTIFLDEIGELPLDLQSKLLRVIEEGEFRRVGGKTDKTVDVRVIAATNRNLRESLREGRFRSDLYYRLSVFPIEAPPLRERPEDVPKLVLFFTAKYAASLGKSVRNVAQGSMDALIAYDWPGNVRELRNVIERSMILSKGDTLTVDPALLGNAPSAPISSGPLKHDLQAVERARILRGLEESGWKIKGERNAASVLGITPSSLRSRMKKLGIVRPTLPQGDAGSEATGAI